MEPSTPEGIEKRRLLDLMRHKNNVNDAAELLAMRLIEKGEFVFAKNLTAKCFQHDCSKFYGVEWECLHRDVDSEERNVAWKQHVETNDHHPEFWGDISEMPRICIAEMVVDWTARSREMGTNLRDWFKESAMEKYSIMPQSKKYKEIKYFLDLIIDPTFK
jgi:hypothetical protein